jgi:L-malate glycosyltransferase
MSNLRPVKRLPDALRVLAAAKEHKNIKLLILAGGSFDEYLPLARELGVLDRVLVHRNVVDIENYIHASDAGLYTSEKESFGMGVLETMSFGKPVVATGVGGVSEIVLDGKTGYLAKLGDIKSMAQKVRKLAADPTLADCMGQAAQVRARQEFSADKSVGRYLDYYHAVLSGCVCGAHNES